MTEFFSELRKAPSLTTRGVGEGWGGGTLMIWPGHKALVPALKTTVRCSARQHAARFEEIRICPPTSSIKNAKRRFVACICARKTLIASVFALLPAVKHVESIQPDEEILVEIVDLKRIHSFDGEMFCGQDLTALFLMQRRRLCLSSSPNTTRGWLCQRA